MARMWLASLAVGALSPHGVSSHAVLTKPQARAGQANGVGVKLTPFGNAITTANTPGTGCGGPQGNPGNTPETAKATYKAGDSIDVEWKMTLPHAADRTDGGVRIAIHFGDGDSYAQNILANGVDSGTVQDQTYSRKVQLPAGKTCEQCVVQWMWSARQDGGYYLGCSDVRITSTGEAGEEPGGSSPFNFLVMLAGAGVVALAGGAGLAMYVNRSAPGVDSEAIELTDHRDVEVAEAPEPVPVTAKEKAKAKAEAKAKAKAEAKAKKEADAKAKQEAAEAKKKSLAKR